jgi:hypothetical protein
MLKVVAPIIDDYAKLVLKEENTPALHDGFVLDIK